MCGIVADLPSYAVQLLAHPAPGDLESQVPSAVELLGLDEPSDIARELIRLHQSVDRSLAMLARAGTASLLMADRCLLGRLRDRADELAAQLEMFDAQLDGRSASWDAEVVENIAMLLRAARDSAFGLGRDRLDAVIRTTGLMGPSEAGDARAVVGYLAIDRVLCAVDRLEVRGRDSAGVSVWIDLDPIDLAELELGDRRREVLERADPLLRGGSVRLCATGIVFVYKRSAIVGSLGDNVSDIRASIAEDLLFHEAMELSSARVSVLAHTRWASVGPISEANAHPVDSRVDGRPDGPLTFGVLNGDIDNHRTLRPTVGLVEDGPVATDAKLVPVVLSRHAVDAPVHLAMALALREFDGSMAIATQNAVSREELVLAVKGSGQGLYVGVAESGFMVASEVYGLVAATRDYLRLDGGRMPGASTDGTIVRLRRDATGAATRIDRYDADGRDSTVSTDEIRVAELTTRDLALGSATHYLQKEIGEASSSLRKTLRSRIRPSDTGLFVDLPTTTVPDAICDALAEGRISRLRVIGQGTAAVAAQGVAGLMATFCSTLDVRAVPATEFSAYELENDLSDMLIVAISQSGSTTDTNRTVDLARQRGASVLAIINRRDSDLAAKAEGVLYTSDGRDVEMAVASTKAFYAQVAAGCLLALRFARLLETARPEKVDALLQSLLALPAQLDELYRNSHEIAAIARETVTRHQNWSVVGSGPNRVAAAEARIKLSELCYRAVSTDAIEDKKHVDLSAESLVLICAAGTPPGQLADIRKEVEIFSAHRNTPVVITDADPGEPWPTPRLIRVPAARPELAWILSTAAAHLFAYHAAAAIDDSAAGLRTALALLEKAERGEGDPISARVAAQDHIARFVDMIGDGEVIGLLTPRSVAALTATAAGSTSPRLGSPDAFTAYVLDPDAFLRTVLATAIDELTRSIDTVKHQAKTVTVGTSRDDAAHYANAIAVALADGGCDPSTSLSHAVLTAISEHAALTTRILGLTRYRLRPGVDTEIIVAERSGISLDLASRAETWSPLVGSKELVARSRRARLLRGARDGRLVLIVPEQDGAVLSGIAVVHLELAPQAEGPVLMAALSAHDGRVDELRAAVTEAGNDFDVALLAELPVEDVLLAPVDDVARRLATLVPAG